MQALSVAARHLSQRERRVWPVREGEKNARTGAFPILTFSVFSQNYLFGFSMVVMPSAPAEMMRSVQLRKKPVSRTPRVPLRNASMAA